MDFLRREIIGIFMEDRKQKIGWFGTVIKLFIVDLALRRAAAPELRCASNFTIGSIYSIFSTE